AAARSGATLALAGQVETALRQPWQPLIPVDLTAPSVAAQRAVPHCEIETAAPGPGNGLRHWNGHGGFDAEGSEYVMPLTPDGTGRLQGPPLPWINVVANPHTGFLASETGAGYTWTRNSRQHRLTPWFNDPVLDPHGEAFYLRDEDAGQYWSPLPGPVPGGAYVTRHGFGYSHFQHDSHGLTQHAWQFVPQDDALKITRFKITNHSGRTRRLSLFAYQQIVLGVLPEETREHIVSAWQDHPAMLIARNPAGQEFADRLTFAAYSGPRTALHHSADRAAFIGGGTLAQPAALTRQSHLDGRSGAGLSPCFALQAEVVLQAGETLECAFLLGEATTPNNAAFTLARYAAPVAIQAAQNHAASFWRRTLSALRIATPEPALDLMINGWLAYQNLSCRIWGRSAFYQSGGAYGYRDQLQDSAALVYLRPDLTRAQIILHAGHQLLEGDVLHWWHQAPMEMGLRTRFADDLLWLPYITAFYLQATGDWGLLQERAPYLSARPLEPGEDEAYLKPELSGQSEDIYGHCCRAIDRSLTLGAHGLPLFGTGDWNDGMSRVGREGKGESVWMGFFLYSVLGDFLPVCARQGDDQRAQRYQAHREKLQAALNEAGWDGDWYRRAYYDDGAVMGSKDSDECQIDALAQAWSVISGAAPKERAAAAMRAVEQHLISDADQIIRLLTPPFADTPHDPGYIKGYVKGVRENGGQYTHAACWVARAMAELGRHGRAAELLKMLSPVSHATNPEAVAVYQVEPYVIAADIYGVAPHVGRGGWTWYTGSASWYYRVVLESLLGFELRGGTHIRLQPRIPAAWPGFSLDYRLPDSQTVYHIQVINAWERGRPARPDQTAEGGLVSSVALDGTALALDGGAALIPLSRDGAAHRVEVRLG
ncbi:MAG: glycosyl transferase, partial [Methylococcaceae bacterium]